MLKWNNDKYGTNDQGLAMSLRNLSREKNLAMFFSENSYEQQK